MTKKEFLESSKIQGKLNDYGVLLKPYLYDIQIEELQSVVLREEENLSIHYPEFSGLVELCSLYEDKTDKFWKWKIEIQRKVYLALLEEIDFQLEIRTLKRLHILERCPDPKLAKEEEHKRANNSYKDWLTKYFNHSKKSKYSTIETMLIWINKYPVEFWQLAKKKPYAFVRFEIRYNLDTGKSEIHEAIHEGIEQLVNYKFVSENYKERQLEDHQLLRLKELENQNNANNLSGKQKTLLVYYIAKKEDKYPELKNLTAARADKIKIEEFHEKHKLTGLSAKTFRNYYCLFMNKKNRADYLNEDIFEQLKNHEKAYKQAMKDFNDHK